MKQKYTVAEASELMGLDVTTVRAGMLQGIYPIGEAFKTKPDSKRTFFHISPQKLADYMLQNYGKEI